MTSFPPRSPRVTRRRANRLVVAPLLTLLDIRPGAAAPTSGTLRHSLLNRMLQATAGRFELYHVTNEHAAGPGSFVDAVTGGSERTTRIVVFDLCGSCKLGFKSDKKRDGTPAPALRRRDLEPRGNLFVAGETAPVAGDGSGGGFNCHGGLRLRRSNIFFRHLRLIPSGHGPMRNVKWYRSPGGLRLEPDTPERDIVFQNCDLHHTVDTGVMIRPPAGGSITNFAMINCFVGEPLATASGFDELAGAHHWAFQVFRRGWRILAYGNLFLSVGTRLPWFSGLSTMMFTNNFFYNCGGPGPLLGHQFAIPIQMNWGPHHPDATGTAIVDWFGNAFRGGEQTNVSGLIETTYVAWTGKKEPTSQQFFGYYGDNRFYTSCDEIFSNGMYWDSVCKETGRIRVDRIATAAPPFLRNYDLRKPWHGFDYLARPAYADTPAGLPVSPLPSTAVEAHAMAYAGARPDARDANARRMHASIRDGSARVRQSAVPTGFDPTPTAVAVDVEPGGLGTGNIVGGGDHPAVAGYERGDITPLERWLHRLHMRALGIPDGAADYDPDIAGRWTWSTAEPRLP